MLEKVDVFRIFLDSETATTELETKGEYEYDINLPSKKNQYTKIIMYVDNFNICLRGLGAGDVVVNLLNVSQYNSYNSRTGGNNPVICSVYNDNTATGRTNDLVLSYQGATTPISINQVPTHLSLSLTDIDNVGIDLSNAQNFWNINMRLECFYEEEC